MVHGLRGAAVVIAASILIVSGCSGSNDAEGEGAADAQGEGTVAESADSSGCTPPQDGSELRDQDFDDSQLPWERDGADPVTIHFESGDVDDEYRGHLESGAAAWNRSPCLDVRIVDRCPADSNCVTVSLTPGDDADGNFDAVEEGGFTVAGHIDLYVEELERKGDGAKLNVTIHEMGHAVGLRHRVTERVLMNGDTYDDIFDPDETDLYNLRVLYGNQS